MLSWGMGFRTALGLVTMRILFVRCVTSESLPTPATCVTTPSDSLVPLSNCTIFHTSQKGPAVVECVLSPVTSNAWHEFSHVYRDPTQAVFTFRLLSEPDGRGRCVGLRRLSVSTVGQRNEWPAAIQLFGVDHVSIELLTNWNVAVGVAELEEGCWKDNRSSSRCMCSVFLASPLAHALRMQPLSVDYWTAVKRFASDLSGTIHRVELRLDPEAQITLQDVHAALWPALGATNLVTSGWNLGVLTLKGSDLRTVERLELRRNRIKEFSIDYEGISLSQLKYLDLSYNELVHIPNLRELTSLRHLDFTGNKDVVLRQGPHLLIYRIKTLTKMRTLILNDMMLLETEHILERLRTMNLTNLQMSRCGIRTLNGDYAFEHHPGLETLLLAGNEIETLPPRIFSKMSQLTYLDLSSNLISQGPGLQFHPACTKRLRLNMSHNKLQSPEHILQDVTAAMLDLSGNEIQQWEQVDVFTRDQLEPVALSVNLSANRIVSMSEDMVKSLMVLRIVELSHNKLDCTSCWAVGPLLAYLLAGIPVRGARCASGVPLTEASVDGAPCDSGFNLAATLTAVALLLVVLGALLYRYRVEATYLANHLKRRRKNVPSDDAAFVYDAFICYSHHDRPWVIEQLIPQLEGGPERYQLCVHERDFPVGSVILQSVERCMHRSRYTIAVLSDDFVQSQWCRWELEMAHHKLFEERREFVILVQLEPLTRRKIPRRLRTLIETRTFLEWPPRGASAAKEQEAWGRLRKALGRSNYQRDPRPRILPDFESEASTDV